MLKQNFLAADLVKTNLATWQTSPFLPPANKPPSVQPKAKDAVVVPEWRVAHAQRALTLTEKSVSI